MTNRARTTPNSGSTALAGKKRPSRWHRPLWWTNLGFVLLLLLSYLSIHVSPATFWPLAFLGIAYPFILAVNLGFIVWWLLFRRKRILPSLVAVLLGWGHVGDYVRLWGSDEAPDGVGRGVKVMSWNVRLFDLYNWSHNKETCAKMFALLHREDPSILCLQEYYDQRPVRPDGLVTTDSLMANWRFKYLHEEYTAKARYNQRFGIATFSAHPIVGKGAIHFPDDLNNLCIWSDVVVGGDTIRVYNAHLASIRFGDEDYRFMKELDTHTDRDSLASGGLRILGRLKNAFIRRANEVEEIARHIRTSPHPVLYCGDLNDTPMSWGYHHLRAIGLNDAFAESGSGLGHTYIGDFPSFRIDHILHGDGIRSWDLRTLPDELSDHRALTCRVAVVHE